MKLKIKIEIMLMMNGTSANAIVHNGALPFNNLTTADIT